MARLFLRVETISTLEEGKGTLMLRRLSLVLFCTTLLLGWFGHACSPTSDKETTTTQDSGTTKDTNDAGTSVAEVDVHTNIGKMSPEACGSCHTQHFKDWQGSMHAYAAKDPVFLAMNAKGQEETKGKLGQFCVQCHAPTASKLGLTPVSVGSNGKHAMDFDLKKPLIGHGVQCVTCHSIKQVDATLNAKFKLSDTTYFGPTGSAAANEAHPMMKSALLVQSQMCGSCHNVVNPKGALLENTFSEWYSSDYNGATPEKTTRCQDCHMPKFQGEIVKGGRITTLHRHTFVGVDQALIANFPHKAEQAAMVKKLLQSCAKLEIRKLPDVGNQVAIRVDVTNINNGHNLPSGSTADRQVWVHLRVTDLQDKLLYESGMLDKNGDLMDRIEGHSVTPNGDPHLLMFSQFLFDENGKHVNFPWQAKTTKDNLLPPGQTGWREYLIPRSKLNTSTIKVSAVLNYRTFPPFLIRKLQEQGYLKKNAIEPIPIVEMVKANKEFSIR